MVVLCKHASEISTENSYTLVVLGPLNSASRSILIMPLRPSDVRAVIRDGFAKLMFANFVHRETVHLSYSVRPVSIIIVPL